MTLSRREVLIAPALAVPISGCASRLPEGGEIRPDLIGVWKCTGVNKFAEPALVGSELVLDANGRFSWTARSETSEFPRELSGRWAFDPKSNQVFLVEPVPLLGLGRRRLYYNLGANVVAHESPDKLTLAFTFFSDYSRDDPIALTVERVKNP